MACSVKVLGCVCLILHLLPKRSDLCCRLGDKLHGFALENLYLDVSSNGPSTYVHALSTFLKYLTLQVRAADMDLRAYQPILLTAPALPNLHSLHPARMAPLSLTPSLSITNRLYSTEYLPSTEYLRLA